MRIIQKKDIWLFLAQLLLLSLVLLSPGLISFITSNNAGVVWDSLKISAYWLAPALVMYLLNFYLCVPLLWFRHRFWLFALVNTFLIGACNFHILYVNINALPDIYRAGFSSFVIIAVLVNLMAVGIALSIRYMMRQGEKRQREVEAELAWLKNQINPHFLFNTLNNISSLAQIDGDETQEAIMQLSDLLRYAMYETNKPKVPLEDEVEFMRNYIELMKLRCNEMTVVGMEFNVLSPKEEIAPLLFISLIENALTPTIPRTTRTVAVPASVWRIPVGVWNCSITDTTDGSRRWRTISTTSASPSKQTDLCPSGYKGFCIP